MEIGIRVYQTLGGENQCLVSQLSTKYYSAEPFLIKTQASLKFKKLLVTWHEALINYYI